MEQPMRTMTDLLEHRLIFSQQIPLTTTEFLEAYKLRVLHNRFKLSAWQQLEALYRVGILRPMYRLSKNVRAIRTYARREDATNLPIAIHLRNDKGFFLGYLQGERKECSLTDPRTEPFRPWKRYIRKIEERTYWSSSFFYSQYQLLLIPTLLDIVPNLRTRHKVQDHNLSIRASLRIDERTRSHVQEDVQYNDDLIILLTSLETRYLPGLRAPVHFAQYIGLDMDEIDSYNHSFDPVKLLHWSGWTSDQVKDTAERLLFIADTIDPLAEWYQLVRLCHPDKWKALRGDALVAMDHRLAAEMLLQFYEDLVQAKAALPIESTPKFASGPFDERLRPDVRNLDEVLMDFGLSPHPAVMLVLEGPTEHLLVPRVMEILGIPRDRNFIDIFNSNGVDTDFGLLAMHVATPNLGEQLGEDVQLTRPPTHFLVAIDAERRFITPERCERERIKWINRLFEATPSSHRTERLKDDLDFLVSVETWDGNVFEFAHFSPEEIARAILEVYKGANAPSLSVLVSHLERVAQSQNRNIDDVLRNRDAYNWSRLPSKVAVAEALWPVLKRKIEEAIVRGCLRIVVPNVLEL
jgi:hypothetical protein